MRKILSLITVYFVISCSSFLAQAQESDAAIVILFEVGGSETDEAFVEMAQAGARRAKTELGARYVTRSIAPTEDRETVFRGAIAQGKRLLIALGFQHVPVIMKLAKECIIMNGKKGIKLQWLHHWMKVMLIMMMEQKIHSLNYLKMLQLSLYGQLSRS